MRLTSRNVLTLEPGEHRDELAPGLILRVWATGRAWCYRYSLHGKRRRIDLGAVETDRRDSGKRIAENIEQARNLARILSAALVRGEDPHAVLRRHEADGITVRGLCATAMEAMELRPATREGWLGHIRRDIEPTLGDIPAAALSREQIRRWGETITRRSGTSANRAFEALRRVYSWAVEHDILTSTPFVRLPKPHGKGPTPTNIMSIDELAGLVQTLGAEPCGYANAVGLLLLTGVRKEEVRSARLAEISGEVWTIPGERTKNGVEHIVPLSRQAAEIIARQRSRSPWLFPRVHIRRVGDPPKSPAFRLGSAYTRRLRHQVGGSWTLHGFRHALATHGQDVLGFDLQTISAILGHVTPDISRATRIYARGQQLETRREALQAWADWLDSLRWRPRIGPRVAQK